MSNHNYNYDVIVLGGGPGGYVAAIRAAQLGLKTAVVERETLGGVCLNWGCVPSKSLLRNAEVLEIFHNARQFGITFDNLQVDFASAIKRSRGIVNRQTKGVGFLMKKNKIDVIEGHGSFVDANTLQITPSEFKPDGGGQQVTSANFIIATGARARSLPGIEIDGTHVLQYRDAIVLNEQPKRVVIIGAGAIGMEFGYFYSSYGSDVTIVEYMDQVLPNEDTDVAAEVEKDFKRRKVNIMTSTGAQQVTVTDDGVSVLVKNNQTGQEEALVADKVLMSVGIQPNTESVGLDQTGVHINKHGFIEIDDLMRTNIPHIYAIGDCTGKLALAHVASAQGLVASETIGGVDTMPIPHERYIFMPRCTYCQPQVASLGMTEAQAKAAGHEIKVGKFPFMPNGKAQALAERTGFIKIIADAKYGEILGAHLVGPEVTELLPELSLAQFMEITPAEIARNVHAHPSLSEVIMEAAHAVEGHPIHM